MKKRIQWLMIAIMVIGISGICKANQSQVVYTNIQVKTGVVVIVGISEDGTASVDKLIPTIKKVTEEINQSAEPIIVSEVEIPGVENSRSSDRKYCPVYCRNETDYDADVYFSDKKKKRKDWSGWHKEITVPANSDNTDFELRRRMWYRFYFTVNGVQSTISNSFKIRGKRKLPELVLLIVYI